MTIYAVAHSLKSRQCHPPAPYPVHHISSDTIRFVARSRSQSQSCGGDYAAANHKQEAEEAITYIRPTSATTAAYPVPRIRPSRFKCQRAKHGFMPTTLRLIATHPAHRTHPNRVKSCTQRSPHNHREASNFANDFWCRAWSPVSDYFSLSHAGDMQFRAALPKKSAAKNRSLISYSRSGKSAIRKIANY